MNTGKIWLLSEASVYVEGAVRGAIYNFNDGKVYSINEDACVVVNDYLLNKEYKNTFIDSLEKLNLIDRKYMPRKYEFDAIESQLNFAWLEITGNCNLKCLHCYDGDCHKDSDHNLSFHDWIELLNELKAIGCKTVEFIGGEPGTYSKLYALMLHAKSLGLNIELYSNLTMISEDVFRFICENGVTVHFSIYGSTAETHDAITSVKGSFEKTLNMVKRLLEHNVRVIPSTTFMKQNELEVESLSKFMENIGLKLKIDVVRASKYRKIDYLMPNRFVYSKVLMNKPNFTTSREKFNNAAFINTCLFGKIAITPEGDVIPCEFARDCILGNVKKSPISEIINSEDIQSIWYMNFNKINECKDCEYRYACKDCRFLSEKISDKNKRCLYKPLLGIWDEY